VRRRRYEILESLRGNVTRSHRFLLKTHLGMIVVLDAAIAEIETEAGVALEPFRHRPSS
jgi:hypothetical protein